MAGVYMYRDRWARTKNTLGGMMIVFGLGFILASLMGHTGIKMAIHVPFWAGILLAVWGFCMMREAKARAYSEKSRFPAKIFGIVMIIVQILTLAEVVVHKTYDMKTMIFALVPGVFAAVLLIHPFKRKSLTLSLLLIGYAAALLLANMDILLLVSGRLYMLKAALILFFALKLHLRKRDNLTLEEEAQYI